MAFFFSWDFINNSVKDREIPNPSNCFEGKMVPGINIWTYATVGLLKCALNASVILANSFLTWLIPMAPPDMPVESR